MTYAGPIVSTMALYEIDALNGQLSTSDQPRYMLDADALGAQMKPSRQYERWLDDHAAAVIAVHHSTLGEMAVGRAQTWLDAGYAGHLERLHDRCRIRITHVVMPCRRLDDAVGRLLATPAVLDLVRKFAPENPNIVNRIHVLAAVIAYEMILVSSNNFYRELARIMSFPHGVYNPSRENWIVPRGWRPGRVRDRFERLVEISRG